MSESQSRAKAADTPFQPSGVRPIPAFAPSRGGDDLGEARRFVDAAVDAMRTLHIKDAPAVAAWLDAVEGFARPLQARAILRAVARARQANGTDPDMHEQLGRDLTVVGSLIAQYEQGLVDVEAQLEAGEIVVEEAIGQPAPRLPDALEARFEEARTTLAGLLPVVDTHGHFDALESLVAFRPFGDAPLRMTDAYTGGGSADAQTPAFAGVAPAVTTHRVDVDAFLPGLADHIQRMARLHGKPVTVSYASADALLPAHLASEWQAAVETALTALAEVSLEAPSARRARGLALTAHVDMTARGVEGGVCLHVRCPGRTPPRMVVDAPHTFEAREDEGTVTLTFTARDDTACEGAA